MEDRIYRKLSICDLQLLMRMKDDAPDFLVCEENARQFLSNPMNWIFVCIQDNKVIGHALGYELTNIYNLGGNKLYIHSFGVLPQYRRQGVGTGILTGIKEMCKLLGIYKFFLFTEKSKFAACRMYEKSGGKSNINFENDDDCNIVYTFNPLEQHP